MDNFSFIDYLKWVFKNQDNLAYHEPGFILHRLLFLSFVMGCSYVFSRPWKWYYDYKDPLVRGSDDTLDGISADATLRRLKYKQKVAGWQ